MRNMEGKFGIWNMEYAREKTSGDVLSALDEIRLSLLKEMKSIQTTLSQYDKTFENMNERLTTIEKDCANVATFKADVDKIRSIAVQNSEQIAELACSIDDSNDRARRNNLIFYGHKDSERETWVQSKKLIIDHCKTSPNLSLNPRDIERAHRLGTFQHSKDRLIIVKFTHFKDEDRILSNAKN